MTAKIIDGRKIAKDLLEKISQELENLEKKHKIKPNIATVKIGNDPSSDLYLKLRDKACDEVGITSTHHVLAEDTSEEDVINSIKNLNNDQNVHGILIQYPIPEHISQFKLMNIVHPKKDVEGFNSFNLGRAVVGNENLLPCTPLAVLTILRYENIDLQGKDAAIVNHSNIVGKPLAALLLNRNATVSVCHVFSQDIKQYTIKADIVVSAVGKPKLITKDHIKEGSFVIDVGIVKTKDGVCGDVDFDSVKEIAGRVTPVPGGVGPVTIACAIRNMLKTYHNTIEGKK
jgi:methylenetetrahydrofolate dehydrogenase (NADP+)/methenyltetrahydrofolate cyclohydrolase